MIDYLEKNIEIFQCPVCKNDLEFSKNVISCKINNHKFDIKDDIPLLFTDEVSSDKNLKITKNEKLFYEKYPFPNYDDFDNIHSLISKAEKSVFAKQLNDELPFNTRVLEVGCGTGQLTNYLSIAQREIVGVDMSFSSLSLGSKFKLEHNLNRSSFFQMNLFNPIFKDKVFHYIICNGVLHHTHNPKLGFKSITQLLKVGGMIIIGLYNRYGRISTHLRRQIFKLTGRKFNKIDSHLKRNDVGNIKKEMWYMDQYFNPHESTHSYSEVLIWFEENNIEFVTAIPKIFGTKENISNKLLEKSDKGSSFKRFLTEMEMAFKFNNEGGFYIMIGRKK
jgi:2-polyprenyl-3-methyl-5-hydroxy-6-metoxy-1,4-benzoquinol methylase